MAAYYNELDPIAAEWLRELIKQGLIAPGLVDGRSIEDVQPSDLDGFTQCHFFAGIGGWSYALRLAGWSDETPVWTGSCPCQPFSTAGKKIGFTDKRHLWPVWFRLIAERRPAAIFGEQVASPAGLQWFDIVQADLEGTGYAAGAADLCAAGIGAPHVRQRLFFVADSNGTRRRTRWPDEARDGSDSPRIEPAGLRDVGLVAKSGSQRLEEQRLRLQQGRPLENFVEAGRDGEAGGMADAGGERRQQDTRGASPHEAADGRTGRHACQPHSDHESAGDGEDGGGMANADGWQSSDGQLQRSRRLLQLAENPLAGFWAGADWLYCQDGKYRPVEAGTFPLAVGVSGRMGKLRGFGNSIVPQLAAAFIEAYQETLIA